MRDWKLRLAFLGWAPLVILLGLASRRYPAHLPAFVSSYGGDTLYAMLVYLCMGAVLPRTSLVVRAAAALAGCYAIEVSQVYHAPWIDALRHTTLGGLVLGFGFLWSDLVCYAVGVGSAAGVEAAVRRRRRFRDGARTAQS